MHVGSAGQRGCAGLSAQVPVVCGASLRSAAHELRRQRHEPISSWRRRERGICPWVLAAAPPPLAVPALQQWHQLGNGVNWA